MSPLSKRSKTSTPRKGLDSRSGDNPFKVELSPVLEKEVNQENLDTSDSVALIPNIKPIAKGQKILTDHQLNVGDEKKTTTKHFGSDWSRTENYIASAGYIKINGWQ